VIQPENKDSGPGILLPLVYLYKQYPDAAVALFPSDHFILEENTFMRHVDRAFEIVERDGSRIVLLGLEPYDPDPEYGYIVAGELIDNFELGARRVELFVEKLAVGVAGKIIRTGALWNTLIMVATCRTLLNMFATTTPALYRCFAPIAEAIGTSNEQRIIEDVYRGLPSLNFSKQVLEVLALEHRRNLLALPVRGVTWSDWGTSARLSNTLQKLGKSSILMSMT
jgi:mannose-1-phosphate guanylyltransferase